MNLLWIQHLCDLKVKAIKGVDNPADLGTKALSKDKIRKYMVMVSYQGEYLDEHQEASEKTVSRSRVDVLTVAPLVAALTSHGITIVEARKEDQEVANERKQGLTVSMVAMVMLMLLVLSICLAKLIAAAISVQVKKKEEVKKRKNGMAEEKKVEEVSKDVKEAIKDAEEEQQAPPEVVDYNKDERPTEPEVQRQLERYKASLRAMKEKAEVERKDSLEKAVEESKMSEEDKKKALREVFDKVAAMMEESEKETKEVAPKSKEEATEGTNSSSSSSSSSSSDEEAVAEADMKGQEEPTEVTEGDVKGPEEPAEATEGDVKGQERVALAEQVTPAEIPDHFLFVMAAEGEEVNVTYLQGNLQEKAKRILLQLRQTQENPEDPDSLPPYEQTLLEDIQDGYDLSRKAKKVLEKAKEHFAMRTQELESSIESARQQIAEATAMLEDLARDRQATGDKARLWSFA